MQQPPPGTDQEDQNEPDYVVCVDCDGDGVVAGGMCFMCTGTGNRPNPFAPD